MRARLAPALVLALGAVVPAAAWRDAASNLHRVNESGWTGGQPSGEDLALLCGAGVRTVIDLREAIEHDVDAERLSAERLGMAFVHVPVRVDAPSAAAADAFLAAAARPGALPMLVHCASGNRAAGFWMIRRLVVDRWTVAAAEAEARRFGLRSDALRDFAVEYAKRRLEAGAEASREEP